MQECYNWETNTLDFKDLNGTIFHLKLKGTKTIVGGKAGTGKTLICNKLLDIICDDNIDMKPYNASNVFVLTQENRHLLYEQNHKLVIVDRADMILNESEIEFIISSSASQPFATHRPLIGSV